MTGPADDKWDFDGIIIKGVLPEKATLTDVVTMIRYVNDQSIFDCSGVFQRLQKRPNRTIELPY
jgi:hypothetical protein